MALYFAKSHEYVKVDGDIGIVGISNFAQEELGDIIKVILPEKGKKVKAGDEVCFVESPKESAKIYSPISGEIVEVNEELDETPELINEDPYGKGWIFKVKIENPDELKSLLTEEEYEKFIEEGEE